ncbi:ribonuclease III [Halobacteriovorax sp.]|uniref:ribonuclease III n=1 Tax=Halobacteriovorax sp. TaxID=2020862 RepID=UPI003AF2DD39
MLETTSLNPQGKSPTFAHAFYRLTIADFKQLGAGNGVSKHEVTDLFFDQSNIQSIFLDKFDLKFNDNSLVMRAFTHSSYVHEAKLEFKSYERLEFYGDSVLGSYVTKNLFLNFEDMNEGQLSKLRSALVNEDSLSSLTDFLGLSQFLIVGKGELDQEVNKGIRCDLFESILGAIAIDQGNDKANSYLDQVIATYEKESGEVFFNAQKLVDFDPKTKLQEETLARFKCLPEYRTKALNKGQEFEIELYINGELISKLISNSKKIGTKEIAKECLENNLLDKIK